MDLNQAPPLSRTEYVVGRLKADLAAGNIPAGEPIKQTVLAKRYGVSPTPVREAMRILEAGGLIEYSPHRGASVTELTPEAARDLYRLRSAVEGEAAAMAVERMTDVQRVAVEEAHARLTKALREQSDTPAELSLLNRAFHFSIYRCCSPLVLEHVETLWMRFTPRTTVWTPDHAENLHLDHDEILAAVIDGDAVRAQDLTARHIQHASDIRDSVPTLRPAGHG